MKFKYLLSAVFTVAMVSACDDTTNDIGTSLTHDMDNLDVTTDTFQVSSRSIIADSVYARTTVGYLGKIRDPETGGYITGSFMTQFHVLDDYENTFPKADSITSRTDDGSIVADSCELRLFYTSFYGDSLAPMKLRVEELATPVLENRLYYSNFNPTTSGYLREDGINKEIAYSLIDMSVSESSRSADGYTNNIRIPLNDSYTAKDGTVYSNYGTYLMQSYYKNPEVFGNSLRFAKEVVPGFNFEYTGGLGAMANIVNSKLIVYFHYQGTDSIESGIVEFGGTEEVLQTTAIENDRQTILDLAADNTCTYLKTPAGIFTEMTIPVDNILSGHDNDTINTAKIVIPRINNTVESDYSLGTPANLLMIPKDSLYSFFENSRTVDNRTSYLATNTYLGSNNTYQFANISNLIAAMNGNRSSENWNKVVLIPVTVSTISTSIVSHTLSLTSTKLVGGSANPHDPIKISVIYSKFK
ncbi:MAG: DUF4270 domain-containing protein [Prevotella sp.]|nr:DUF4270 domain-containing protein [Prevotella sp.]